MNQINNNKNNNLKNMIAVFSFNVLVMHILSMAFILTFILIKKLWAIIFFAQISLYRKYNGVSCVEAAREYIILAMEGKLFEGWSRSLLDAMVYNNQGHIGELLRPS